MAMAAKSDHEFRAGDTGSAEDLEADIDLDTRAGTVGTPPRNATSDPWQVLLQVGTQFVAALAAANGPDAIAHPWVERDPATGVQSLKIPLPSPETAMQLANALSTLADSLRGGLRDRRQGLDSDRVCWRIVTARSGERC